MRPKELSRKPTGAGRAHTIKWTPSQRRALAALAGSGVAVYDVSSTPFEKKEQLCLKRIYWLARKFW
jgi:hypothetical protein